MWFSKGWQGCSTDFLREILISWGKPCQPKKNPILSDTFNQIFILFLIGFRIGPPKLHVRYRIGLPKMHRQFRIGPSKMHRRFRIGPAKMHRRFRIGPPLVSLNLLPPELHRQGIMLTNAIVKEKQQNNLFEIEWWIYPLERSHGKNPRGWRGCIHHYTPSTFPHNVPMHNRNWMNPK